MKTEITRYTVQYKSVFTPDGRWQDYEDRYLSIPDAYKDLSALRQFNPNVRLIKRTTVEIDISQL